MFLRGRLSFLMLLPALALLAACPEPCGALGDPTAAPELVPAALQPGGPLAPLAEGDPIDVLRPIQGGHVLFAGAFVRNVARCSGGGSLRGELRRDSGGKPGGLLYFDERTVYLEPVQPGEAAPPGPGWGRPPLSIGEVANIPICPNLLDTEFLDQPTWLQISYTGADGKAVSTSRRVVPRCRQPHPGEAALCRCECSANYTIERCQIRDGGL